MLAPDAKPFRVLLEGVYEFYRQPLSNFVTDVWWQAMRCYDFAAVRDAMGRHVANPDNGQFLPKPADVVRLLDGGNQDAALLAWTAVDRAVRTVGPYESVVFDDPLVHVVVTDMGGWPALCSHADAEWPFIRNEFVTRYRGSRMRTGVEHQRILTGIAQQANALADMPIAAPLAIGDTKRARQVYRAGVESTYTGPVRLSDLGLSVGEPPRLQQRESPL